MRLSRNGFALYEIDKEHPLALIKAGTYPWCLGGGDGGGGGGSRHESCFHSNPNIAARRFEQRWEAGAKQPSII